MTIISTDIRRLALLLMPTFLRRPLMAALCGAMAEPLAQLTESLRSLRTITERRLAAGPQTCTLQNILNDVLDPGLRRIEVLDPPREEDVEPLTLHLRDDQRPLWPRLRNEGVNVVLSLRGLSGTNAYDFWIYLPHTAVMRLLGENNARKADDIKERRARALADTYKLASKRYKVAWKPATISGGAIEHPINTFE